MYPLKLEAVPMYSKRTGFPWCKWNESPRNFTSRQYAFVNCSVSRVPIPTFTSRRYAHAVCFVSYVQNETSSIVCNARNSKLVDIVLKYDLVTRKSDSVKGLTAVTRSFPNICVFLV